jgi:hypothetical protein
MAEDGLLIKTLRFIHLLVREHNVYDQYTYLNPTPSLLVLLVRIFIALIRCVYSN